MFKFDKVKLKKELTRVKPFVSKDRTELTSLIKIHQKDSIVFISASNGEIGIDIPTSGVAVTKGNIYLRFVELEKFASSGTGDMTVSSNDKDETVSMIDETVTRQFNKNVFSYDGFSEFDEIITHEIAEDVIEVNRFPKNFLNSLELCMLSIDNNNPKFELNGMFLDMQYSGFTMVSTDTRRLFHHTTEDIDADVSNSSFKDVIVPKSAVREIIALIKFYGNSNNIYAKFSCVIGGYEGMFYIGNAVVFTRLIAGKFPEHKRIIPKEFVHFVELTPSDFIPKLTRIAKETGDVRLKVLDGNSTLEALYDEDYQGTMTSEIDAKFKSGSDVNIGFSGKYMLDSVSKSSGDCCSIEIRVNGNNLPFEIKTMFGNTVIMPIVL